MKALTLTQPWASLVAIGAKRIETRSWTTKYRGPLAIHAAKTMPRWARSFAYADPAGSALNAAGIMLGNDCEEFPRGAVVATCRLVDVVRTEVEGLTDIGLPDGSVWDVWRERDFGDYTLGRFAWLLADVEPLAEPVPAKGQLGLWDWERAA